MIFYFDLTKSFNSFKVILPDLESTSSPFLNTTNVGNPEISYFSISSSFSSPLTFKNLTSVSSSDALAN